jgi:hypothetical protein
MPSDIPDITNLRFRAYGCCMWTDEMVSKDTTSSEDPLERLRAICLALPEATEQAMRRGPTFRVRSKIFVMERRGDGRISIWCKAPRGAQGMLVDAAPDRFFVPPYVGPKGWIGVRIDREVDWEEVADLIAESYRLTAPRDLADQLEP